MSVTALDLASMWANEQDYLPRDLSPEQLAKHRRTFYAGALAVLDLQRGGATREALMAEIVDFGRTVGSVVETAR